LNIFLNSSKNIRKLNSSKNIRKKMSYFRTLRTQQWVHVCSPNGSYYRLKLGSSGRNGCCVPQLNTAEYNNICQWFMTRNVVVKNEESELWWSHFPFSYHTPLPGNRRGMPVETMYSGGYEFRLSCEAYAVMFPTIM